MTQMVLDGTGVATPPELRLTRRQRFALEIVAEKEPVGEEELGAYLHELRAIEEKGSGHDHLSVCRFCRQEGRAMLVRLREFGLVRQSRKLGGWRLESSSVRELLKRGAPYDPDEAEIPF